MNLKRRVIRATIFGLAWSLTALAITIFITPYIDDSMAQQAYQLVAVAGDNGGAKVYNTSLTIAAITPIGNGTRSIFGWRTQGPAAACFVQVFDTNATVTVGTTVPTFAFQVFGSSSLGPFISPFPVFTATSVLQLAATTTATGNGSCGNIPTEIYYKQ